MDKKITVEIKSNFGNEAIYPICADAKTFTEMLGRKTLTRRDIDSIKKLGYVIVVKPTVVAF